MKKAKLYIAAAIILSVFATSSNAQSIVDPGVSVYNYKHPNKAAQAKRIKKDQTVVQVASLGSVEKAGKYQRQRYMSSTPKYAPRPTSLIVYRDYTVEGIEINPLLSPRNYKTPIPAVKASDTTQLADSNDKSVYPTMD